MNKMKLSLVITVLVIFGLPLIFALPWIYLYFGILLSPNPAEPEIKSKEFPFVLEYQINGESVTVADVLICEYSGIAMNEGVGKYREWQSKFSSGKQQIVLLECAGITEECYESMTENDTHDYRTTIYFNPGDAAYYMGDDEFHNSSFPDAQYCIEKRGELIQDGIVFASDLSSKYGIELSSWTIGEPIENSFY